MSQYYTTMMEEIMDWNSIRNNQDALKNLFLENQYFHFISPEGRPGVSPNIHVYPALSSGKIVFYIVSRLYDNEDTTNWEEVAKKVDLSTGHITSTRPPVNLDPEVAMQWRKNWNERRSDWVDVNVPNANIYQLLLIPTGDTIASVEYNAFFALKPSTEFPPFTKDLVIFETSDEPQELIDIDFKNTVTPCPPYGFEESQQPYIWEQVMTLTQSNE